MISTRPAVALCRRTWRGMAGSIRSRPWWHVSLALVLVFNGLRFVHLAADFPPGLTTSRALYTDEGWYSLNALTGGAGGGWYVPGELNTVVNLPVGPILQMGAFSLLGVSLTVARGLVATASILLIASAWLLVRRYASRATAMTLAVLLSANFFLFAYSRLAILDFVAVALAVVAFLAAARMPSGRDIAASALSGAALAAAILTKSTAACAVPALAYLCASRSPHPRRRLLLAVWSTGVSVFLVGAYSALAWQRFPVDFEYFQTIAFGFDAASGPVDVMMNLATALFHLVENQPVVSVAAVVTSGLAAASPTFRGNVLVRASLLWVAGFFAMLSLVSYQPSRYFTMAVVPILMLVALAVAELPAITTTRHAGALASFLVGAIVVFNAGRIAVYLAKPTFSFESMSHDVTAIVNQDGGVLLGDMSATISLATGVQSMGMTTGTTDFASRLRDRCPTHFITLQDPDEQEVKTLRDRYSLEHLRSWSVFGDYHKGRQVQLFRLHPRESKHECSGRRELMARNRVRLRPLIKRLHPRFHRSRGMPRQ